MQELSIKNSKLPFSFISVFIRLILLSCLIFIGIIYYILLHTDLTKYFVVINAVLSLIIIIKWDTKWLKKYSIKWIVIIQLLFAGLYLVLFILPSHKCGAESNSANIIYSCDCLGIKKYIVLDFTSRCIGKRTKCYLGSSNEVPCEGSIEFFRK
jgi:hypothetical protein